MRKIYAVNDIRFSNNISTKKYFDLQNTPPIPISYKIPLVIPLRKNKNINGLDSDSISSKVIDFKHFVIENLSMLLSKEDSLLFFTNSFSIQYDYLPPDLLNLKVISKHALGTAIQNIWKRYKSRMFDEDWLTRKQINELDKLRKTLEEEKKKPAEIESAIKNYTSSPRYKIKNSKIKKADKLGFMKVLYNSFPHVREGYQNTLKRKNKLSIEDYLKSRISSTIRD